jgi:hypothetical protein
VILAYHSVILSGCVNRAAGEAAQTSTEAFQDTLRAEAEAAAGGAAAAAEGSGGAGPSALPAQEDVEMLASDDDGDGAAPAASQWQSVQLEEEALVPSRGTTRS